MNEATEALRESVKRGEEMRAQAAEVAELTENLRENTSKLVAVLITA